MLEVSTRLSSVTADGEPITDNQRTSKMTCRRQSRITQEAGRRGITSSKLFRHRLTYRKVIS